ncbi:MAG TPA: CsgG/HfaB family protein [Limnochordales bacterium]|nr:CsgG/HfaB family protein [Limnochordales bacterium]
MAAVRLLVTALLVLAVLSPLALAAGRPLIAVMPFEEGRIEGEFNRRWWQREGPQLLDAIREAFTDQLIESGRFRVLERSRLDQVMKELRLQTSEWFDPTNALQIGRLLGAPYLLMGTVTRFDLRETGYIHMGKLAIQGSGADIGLRVRIVETETAIALAAVSAAGAATSGDLFFKLPKSLSGALHGDSPVYAAAQRAVDELVEKVIAAFEELMAENAAGSL